jgi:hypothetical protein
MKIYIWKQDILYTTEYYQQSRQQSVTDRTSCIVFRCSWCDSVMKVHAAADYESDDSKDSFSEEFE